MVIVNNYVDEEVAEEPLHYKGYVIGFFVVLVCCLEFGMAGSNCTGWDIRLWAHVMGGDEVWATACGVKLSLHHEDKMSFLSTAIGTGGCHCILVVLPLNFLHVGIRRFAITWGEFWEWKATTEGFSVHCIHGGEVSVGH